MMYKEDQNYLWQNLTDVQRERITKHIENALDYLILNILEVLEKDK